MIPILFIPLFLFFISGFQLSRRVIISPADKEDGKIGLPKESFQPHEKRGEISKESIMSLAKLVNTIGQVVILMVMIIFNIIFWCVALTEYTKPIEYYLKGTNNSIV